MPIALSTGEVYESEFDLQIGKVQHTAEGYPFVQAQEKPTETAPITQNSTPEDTSLRTGQEVEGWSKLGQSLTEGMVPEMATRMASDVVAAATVFGRAGRGEIDLNSTEGMNEVMNAALTFGTMGIATAFKRPGLGMFGGRYTKESAMMADQLENRGVSPKLIKETTGLERAAGGQWRLEFSDAKAVYDPKGYKTEFKFNDPALERMYAKVTGNKPSPEAKVTFLENVLDHPALYEAYPEARNLHVISDPDFKKYVAMYVPWNGRPDNPSIIIKHLDDAVENRKSILHEVQHWIQHMSGTPFEDIEGIPKHLKEKYAQVFIKQRGKTPSADDVVRGLTLHFATEVEARNTEARSLMSPEQLRRSLGRDTEDVPRGAQFIRNSQGKVEFGAKY